MASTQKSVKNVHAYSTKQTFIGCPTNARLVSFVFAEFFRKTEDHFCELCLAAMGWSRSGQLRIGVRLHIALIPDP
jgi:hypothetical protein